MKRAFWSWYLLTTAKGSDLFQKAADNLVLYTKINSTTAFYRLKNATFGRKINFYVSPLLRRKIVMLTATIKLCLRNHKKEAFDKIKESAQSIKKTAVLRMLEATKKKQVNCLKLWMKNTKTKNRKFQE
jgi:hypothetical protein